MNDKMRNLVLILLALTLAGCGSMSVDEVLPDKAVEYKREKQAERNLELPPDLTSDRINDRMSVPDNFGGGVASYSEYVTDQQLRTAEGGTRRVGGSVLPSLQDIEVRRDDDIRWLLINAPAEDVWQKVVDFWQENGILMAEQDPTVGVMRTSWLENRAEISRDFITDSIRSVLDGLYDTGTRDQYRIRLERVGNGQTELYLTHFGMQEQVQAASGGGVETTIWVPRERDPELEAEMLRRIMVYMGASDERARARLAAGAADRPVRSQLINTRDGTQLLVDETFSRAWRLVGLSLDRVGFAVEDRDRSQGIYYVRYNDPSKEDADKGWLSSLAFWSDDDIDKTTRYQVKVGTTTERTVVIVADEQGQRDNSPTAIRILTLLQEQIK
jgi:outer membrane protein assembly factor BamC